MTLLWRLIRAFAAFLLVAIIVLVAEGHRKDAGVVRLTADIDTTPELLWPWLDEGAPAKKWVEGLVEVRSDPAVPGPVGKTEVWVMQENGQKIEVSGTCTEYLRPSRLSAHLSVPGTFDGDQTYQLTDLGGGRTRLEVIGTFHYSGWLARLLEPFITHQAKNKLDADISRLARTVKAQSTSGR